MELSYKGYRSTVKFDGAIYHGRIDNIKDFVIYGTSSKSEIKNEFRQAVDDYIKFKGGNNMTFKTSKRINNWVEEHEEECQTHATAGEQFVFEFLPSGIVECQTVKCLCCGKEYTDYVD